MTFDSASMGQVDPGQDDTGADAAQRRTGTGRPGPSPRPVIRGESQQTQKQQRSQVDWLNATFQTPTMSVQALIAMLSKFMGRPVTGAEGKGGRFGFEHRVDLSSQVGSKVVAGVGCIAWGGEAQQGRTMLQLTGVGCAFVRDWQGLRELLEGLEARLTRVDLALDFLDGKHTVDEAVQLWQEGGFTSAGRPPSSACAGDWIGREKGRTFYVGKATNGKMLRVYEKGKQLGRDGDEWVRWEVQLGNRDRVIPYEVLTECDTYLAGCYPAMQLLIEDAATRIPTEQKGGLCTLQHLLLHMRRSYGKLLDVLQKDVGAESAELLEEVRVIGLPKRLNPSSLAAGLSWAQLLACIKGK